MLSATALALRFKSSNIFSSSKRTWNTPKTVKPMLTIITIGRINKSILFILLNPLSFPQKKPPSDIISDGGPTIPLPLEILLTDNRHFQTLCVCAKVYYMCFHTKNKMFIFKKKLSYSTRQLSYTYPALWRWGRGWSRSCYVVLSKCRRQKSCRRRP